MLEVWNLPPANQPTQATDGRSFTISPGFQARSKDQEIKRRDGGRWSWTLKLAQKRSWAGRWSWAAKVGLLSLRVVPQQQCNGHCPCDWLCLARQLKQQLRSALVAAQWRGDTALTLPLFRRRSTVSPVFFGRYPRSSLHSFVLRSQPPRPPTPGRSPSLISHLASVDVKQNVLGHGHDHGHGSLVPGTEESRFDSVRVSYPLRPLCGITLGRHGFQQ